MHWYETDRQAVRALVGTPAYQRSRRPRYKIEASLRAQAENDAAAGYDCADCDVSEQFLMAATAQNLKRLVRFLTQRNLSPGVSGA